MYLSYFNISISTTTIVKTFLAAKLSIVKQNERWFNTNSLFVDVEK